MECLFPVSGLGSNVYSMMTDKHKMEWRVSISSLQPRQAAEAVVPALMKQDRKRHWIKFSCEPWPPNRGKEGSFEEEDSWVLVSRP